MIAYKVMDDPDYSIKPVVVEKGFPFETQYDVWRTEEEALVELKKRLSADIEYLQEILATI